MKNIKPNKTGGHAKAKKYDSRRKIREKEELISK